MFCFFRLLSNNNIQFIVYDFSLNNDLKNDGRLVRCDPRNNFQTFQRLAWFLRSKIGCRMNCYEKYVYFFNTNRKRSHGETVDYACCQRQLAVSNNVMYQKRKEYSNRRRCFLIMMQRHIGKECHENRRRRILRNRCACGLPNLSFICTDGPRTFRATLQFPRRSQKMARWVVCGQKWVVCVTNDVYYCANCIGNHFLMNI